MECEAIDTTCPTTPPQRLYRGGADGQWKNMSEYNKKLKAEIKQIQLDTIALKRINAEMKKELAGELTFEE